MHHVVKAETFPGLSGICSPAGHPDARLSGGMTQTGFLCMSWRLDELSQWPAHPDQCSETAATGFLNCSRGKRITQ